jgi:hypothetical protein
VINGVQSDVFFWRGHSSSRWDLVLKTKRDKVKSVSVSVSVSVFTKEKRNNKKQKKRVFGRSSSSSSSSDRAIEYQKYTRDKVLNCLKACRLVDKVSEWSQTIWYKTGHDQ